MHIRPFQPGDIGPVTSLVRTVLASMDLRADFGGLGVDVHAVGLGERSGTWVAEEGEDVVGVAFVQGGDGGGCELRRLYVATAHVGRGVGSSLLDTATAWARVTGYGRMDVRPPADLDAAIGFFEARGFQHQPGDGGRRLVLDL